LANALPLRPHRDYNASGYDTLQPSATVHGVTRTQRLAGAEAGKPEWSKAEGLMGQLASFTEIAPDMFEEILAGEDPDVSGLPHHSIDKAWDSLNTVLQTKGPPLSLAITGDTDHPQGGHNLDEFIAGDYEYYIALMSPGLVQEVAKALKNVTAKQFKQWEIDSVGDRQSAVEAFFPNLKAAYRDAAKAKNGLMIIIA
jgi:hypothetical protein